MTRIDAHQHFWRYRAADYPWITDALAPLRRDFLPSHLAPELAARAIDGTIAVQARASVDETRWLLALADEHPWIHGVVGWVDLCAPDAAARLGALALDRRLVGLRHLVQDEPDDRFLLRDDFRRGIGALAQYGLVYDLLVFSRHLPAARELVARFPAQPFVLDHLGKPAIARREREPWASELRALARHSNVACKLSGLVTEADWRAWRDDDLRFSLDVALEAFGPQRVLFGSDWPVCLLAASYERVFEVVDRWSSALEPRERDSLFGENAARVYARPRPTR